ncbi:MAG: DNA repair protein RecN [Desulfobulbus sp.]|nr:DNA repair protein RecN [Desulfobulbus sp.]
MLHELRVTNLALIDSLHLDLSALENGLIVLTGETGAGKSIVLQAINLLTGGRGAGSWVRNDCMQADIEAVFSVRPDHHELNELLEQHALTDGDICIVRRVLTHGGRSRIFINDQAVTSRLTGDVTAALVNIASQHDHQQLLNVRYHLDYLDTFGELQEARRHFSQLFLQWQQLSAELQRLRKLETEKEQQRDYLRFQLEEIRKLNPSVNEDEELLRERDRLKSADALLRLIGNSRQQLEEISRGVLIEIRKDVEQAVQLDQSLLPAAERLASAGYELSDVCETLRAYLQSLTLDPGQLDAINERLAQIKQLQRKFGPTLQEVVDFAQRAESELALLEDLEMGIAALELQVEKVSSEVMSQAAELSEKRRKAALQLEQSLAEELAELSFPQAVFRVAVNPSRAPGLEGVYSSGQDQVEFLFSANPGEPVKPLAKIVSGGELSRLMLAMKCLLARRDQVDTVIFDEVDAGIGGQAAEAVAGKIRELAEHHQVICITHLPQIAARADLHFKVEKRVEEGRTRTVIKSLTEEEQLAELARMLGGDHPTVQTLAFAADLMKRKKKRRSV